MDFIKSFKQRFSTTANKAIKASNEMVEVSKVMISINSIKTDIDTAYRQIGEKVYQSYTSDEGISEDTVTICQRIDELKTKLDELNERRRELKKIKLCPNCGSENAAEHKFCKDCGAQISDED